MSLFTRFTVTFFYLFLVYLLVSINAGLGYNAPVATVDGAAINTDVQRTLNHLSLNLHNGAAHDM